MKPSKKTAFILSVFLATASTIAFTGCDSVENAKNEMDESVSNMQDKKLTDDNGKVACPPTIRIFKRKEAL